MTKRAPPQIDWNAMQPGQTGWTVIPVGANWQVYPFFEDDLDEFDEDTAAATRLN